MACINIDEEKVINNSASSPETNPDFLVIRVIGRIVISVIKQCWALTSAMFITICIFYWIFGGISAFILLCFSAAGNISSATLNLFIRGRCVSVPLIIYYSFRHSL